MFVQHLAPQGPDPQLGLLGNRQGLIHCCTDCGTYAAGEFALDLFSPTEHWVWPLLRFQGQMQPTRHFKRNSQGVDGRHLLRSQVMRSKRTLRGCYLCSSWDTSFPLLLLLAVHFPAALSLTLGLVAWSHSEPGLFQPAVSWGWEGSGTDLEL